MSEYLRIVPSVATEGMAKAMSEKANEIINENDTDWSPEHGEKDVWEAALSAAPDTNHLVIVERERLVKLEQIEAAALKLGNTDINDTNAIDAADNELWRLLDDK